MKLNLANIDFAALAPHALSVTPTKTCTRTTLGFRIPVGGNDPTLYTWFYVHSKYDGTTSYETMDWGVHCSGDVRYFAQALEFDYTGGFLQARVKYEGWCIVYEKEDKRTRQNDHGIAHCTGVYVKSVLE
ncbi:hypothetical protein BG003_001689 [Podila horticola]|nr:hypothetical protein BG003_001689 [Podila horticola]